MRDYAQSRRSVGSTRYVFYLWRLSIDSAICYSMSGGWLAGVTTFCDEDRFSYLIGIDGTKLSCLKPFLAEARLTADWVLSFLNWTCLRVYSGAVSIWASPAGSLVGTSSLSVCFDLPDRPSFLPDFLDCFFLDYFSRSTTY